MTSRDTSSLNTSYFLRLFLLKQEIPQNKIPAPEAERKKNKPIPIGEPQ